jgi:uncharacterized protein YndB with AHSA1/START domain
MTPLARGSANAPELAGAADTEAGEDLVSKECLVAAPPARVFAALTESDEIERWFAQVALVEPRAGGAAEFVFYNRNGTFSVFVGEVTEFVPLACVAFTWHSPPSATPPLHVRFTLAAAPRGTRLSLVHSGFAGQPIERDVYDEGWDHYLRRLASAVAEG